MSSTYSNSLRVELIGSGDQAGTWGTTTDNNFAYIFDTAIAGINTVTISSVNQALTYVNGPTSSSALNQSIYAILKLNGAAAASAIYAPPVSKQYIIWNNSSFTITIYNSTVIGNTTAAGTGIAITAGNKIMVWSDGTNFFDVQAQNLTGTLAIVNGGTGQVTANAAFNALAPSQASANGKYLKSDGTNTSWDAIDISTSDVTGVLLGANGGTGVANTGKTVTLGGNLTTSGAFATTLTSTGTTNVTLPTTGTLATLAGSETLTNKTLTSPTLTTPALGTPASGTMTNVTGLPLTTGVTGTLPVANGGTGVTTSTGSGNNVLSTSPTFVTPILGTPTSGTMTNVTGLPLTTGVTGTLPVANGGTGVTTSTGSGNNVLSTSPTLTTPVLGTPSSGTLTSCTGLPLTTGVTGTLPIANGGTGTTSTTFANLTTNVTGTLPIANGGTNATTAANARTNLGLAIGTDVQAWDSDLDTWATKTAPSGVVVGTTDTQTLTNKTLTSPTISSPTISSPAISSPTISGTPTGVGVLTSGTAVASTSGTSVQFASIPSWVKRVTMMLQGVSTSGVSQKLFQLGTGGTPTFATSGYASTSSFIAAASPGTAAYTNGFNLYNLVTAAETLSGMIVFSNLTGDTWVCSGSVGDTSGTIQTFPSGSITLGAVLTAVRMTTANGTDTFDAGTINILFE